MTLQRFEFGSVAEVLDNDACEEGDGVEVGGRRGRTLRSVSFQGRDYFPFFKTDMAFRARSSTT